MPTPGTSTPPRIGTPAIPISSLTRTPSTSPTPRRIAPSTSTTATFSRRGRLQPQHRQLYHQRQQRHHRHHRRQHQRRRNRRDEHQQQLHRHDRQSQNGTLILGNSNAIPNNQNTNVVLGNSTTSGVIDLAGFDLNVDQPFHQRHRRRQHHRQQQHEQLTPHQLQRRRQHLWRRHPGFASTAEPSPSMSPSTPARSPSPATIPTPAQTQVGGNAVLQIGAGGKHRFVRVRQPQCRWHVDL